MVIIKMVVMVKNCCYVKESGCCGETVVGVVQKLLWYKSFCYGKKKLVVLVKRCANIVVVVKK